MSSSKAKKVEPKGIVRELKLVQTVSRRGTSIIKTEEVVTPKHGANDTASTSQRSYSSSPNKRRKMDYFDTEPSPIPCHLETDDSYKKRQTLVFLFPYIGNNVLQFSRSKRLLGTVFGTRKGIFEAPS